MISLQENLLISGRLGHENNGIGALNDLAKVPLTIKYKVAHSDRRNYPRLCD